ncbi:hypothetical protein HELRODRAFT_163468 [Helobdella robusta]|uniref:Uncharacterized protein n=1 Tax=Helobdella robusta TaxID=6412 RepID=T1EU35_HELRO|nr:hypothetical protein HELRODRAFT_163468 [Helobdella robusta]ESN96407.1 hypothetical protein HELRODRAFT_163468 [Helobdella robusta]
MYPFNFHIKRTSLFSKSGELIGIKRYSLQDSSIRGLKLPEEFIMEDVRLRSFIQWQRIHAWLGYVLFFFLCNLTLTIVYYPHGNGLLSGALAVGEPLCKEGE